MVSLWALVISIYILVSSALQTHLHSYETKTDWDELTSAFSEDISLKMYKCNSPKYKKFVKTLPTVHFSSMKIPHHKKILFYGTSLLHQALQNILVANGDVLIKDGPLGGYEGNILDTLDDPKWQPRPFGLALMERNKKLMVSRAYENITSKVYEELNLAGYLVKWDFTVNSSITEVRNYSPLQQPGSDKVVANLKRFLKEHQFDIAFFMNPHFSTKAHAKMHEDHKKCISKCAARKDPNETCNGSTCPDPPDEYRDRKDARKLWSAIQNAMPGKVYQVEEWDFIDEQRDEWFHADRKNVIKSFDVLADRFCGVEDNCAQQTKNVGSHQCQPGNVIQISERIVAKMK